MRRARRGALERDLPRPRTVLLHGDVAQVRAVGDEQLNDSIDEMHRVGTAKALDHRQLSGLSENHERVRERGEALTFAPVQHHDRLLDDDACRHLHERAAGEERIVQDREGIGRRIRAGAERGADLILLAGREVADRHTLRLE